MMKGMATEEETYDDLVNRRVGFPFVRHREYGRDFESDERNPTNRYDGKRPSRVDSVADFL